MGDVVAAKAVIVTRPIGPGTVLCDALRAAGIYAVALPAVGTRPVPVDHGQVAKEADVVVFVSPTAVRYGLSWFGQRPLSKVLAVGESTARALAAKGVVARYPDSGATSEDLLKMPELKMLGTAAKVMIVRGRGGREHLACSLRRAGVRVDYVEVYERYCPSPDVQVLNHIRKLDLLPVLLLTSVTAMSNLPRILNAQTLRWLQVHAELVVLSQRLLLTARDAGFVGSAVVSNVPPSELLTTLVDVAHRCDGS